MSLKTFIARNKTEIDNLVRQAGGTSFNYEERRLWVLNDESLYRWARRMGVRI